MSESPVLPPTVIDLIEKAIPSVAVMEALLLLREHRDQAWAVGQLAERLYIRNSEVESCLAVLCAKSLVRKEDSGYRYAPQSEELCTAVDDLAECYRTRLIPLTRAIHAQASRSGVQLFADVFRLRKET